VAASAVAGAVALAAVPPAGTMITGPSVHKRYIMTLILGCSAPNCKKATNVAIQVTAGNPKHPGGKCPYGTDQPVLRKRRFRAGLNDEWRFTSGPPR
jgi:hypothetical protein